MPGSDAITRLVVNTLSWQACRGQCLGAIQARRCFAAVPETLYEVLGVAKTAEKLSIKAAFRKVAMVLSCAPDPKGIGPQPALTHVFLHLHYVLSMVAACRKLGSCIQTSARTYIVQHL